MQLSISLSQPFSLEPYIQGRVALFVSCLGHIPRVWQCLFYLSNTLLGYTLWMLACMLYLSCTLLGPRSLSIALSNLHFPYLAGHTLGVLAMSGLDPYQCSEYCFRTRFNLLIGTEYFSTGLFRYVISGYSYFLYIVSYSSKSI